MVNCWYLNKKAVRLCQKGLFQGRTGAGGAGFAGGGTGNAVPAGAERHHSPGHPPGCWHLQAVFYGNYYTSLAELVIHIINYEITLLLREVQQSVENQDMSLEEIIHHFWIWSHIAASTISL